MGCTCNSVTHKTVDCRGREASVVGSLIQFTSNGLVVDSVNLSCACAKVTQRLGKCYTVVTVCGKEYILDSSQVSPEDVLNAISPTEPEPDPEPLEDPHADGADGSQSNPILVEATAQESGPVSVPTDGMFGDLPVSASPGAPDGPGMPAGVTVDAEGIKIDPSVVVLDAERCVVVPVLVTDADANTWRICFVKVCIPVECLPDVTLECESAEFDGSGTFSLTHNSTGSALTASLNGGAPSALGAIGSSPFDVSGVLGSAADGDVIEFALTRPAEGDCPESSATCSVTVSIAPSTSHNTSNLPDGFTLEEGVINHKVAAGQEMTLDSSQFFDDPSGDFEAADDDLPAGATLDATTGVISGVPAEGDYSFVVTNNGEECLFRCEALADCVVEFQTSGENSTDILSAEDADGNPIEIVADGDTTLGIGDSFIFDGGPDCDIKFEVTSMFAGPGNDPNYVPDDRLFLQTDASGKVLWFLNGDGQENQSVAVFLNPIFLIKGTTTPKPIPPSACIRILDIDSSTGDPVTQFDTAYFSDTGTVSQSSDSNLILTTLNGSNGAFPGLPSGFVEAASNGAQSNTNNPGDVTAQGPFGPFGIGFFEDITDGGAAPRGHVISVLYSRCAATPCPELE